MAGARTTVAPSLPGPRGRRLVGNLQDYEEDRLGFLLAARDEFGGLVAFDRRTTIVNDGPLARELLQDRERRLAIRENFLQERLTVEGLEDVVRVRRLLNPGLRRSTVATAAPGVAALVDETLGSCGAGPVDPVPFLERVTSHAVASYYFGAEGDVLPEPLGRLLDALAVVIGNPFALPPNPWSPVRRRIGRRHREVLALILPLLRRRAGAPSAYGDFAAELVAARAAGTSLERLAHLVVGSMLAAHRVPAAAAGWMLMLVADHPGTRARLAGDAAYPFATAVVLETLRLYPATWLISRTALAEVELAGLTFPAGHHFLVSPYVVHRDEREFPDAAAFRPERWLGPGRPSGTFLAFGHGRHACPGNNLAVLTLVTLLQTVASRWRFSRVPGPVTPDPRTTLLPQGLTISFERRIPRRGDGSPARMTA